MTSLMADFSHLCPCLVTKTSAVSAGLFALGRSSSDSLTAATVSGHSGHLRGTPVFGRGKLTQPAFRSRFLTVRLPSSSLDYAGVKLLTGRGERKEGKTHSHRQMQASCARSSIGQSIGLRNRGLQVQVLPGAFKIPLEKQCDNARPAGVRR